MMELDFFCNSHNIYIYIYTKYTSIQYRRDTSKENLTKTRGSKRGCKQEN